MKRFVQNLLGFHFSWFFFPIQKLSPDFFKLTTSVTTGTNIPTKKCVHSEYHSVLTATALTEA